MGDNRASEYMRGRRILEINPDSPVIAQLKRTWEAAPASAAVTQTVELLYETALLTSGFAIDSPKEFAARYGRMPALPCECYSSRQCWELSTGLSESRGMSSRGNEIAGSALNEVTQL